MYCSNCGRENPEGALFCAFCGQKMSLPAEAEDAARPGAETAAEGERVFMRPDSSRLVRPTAGNPAQPARKARPQEKASEPAREAAPARAVAEEAAQEEDAPRRMSRSARRREAEFSEEKVPERKALEHRAPISPRKTADWEAPSTIVPRRERRLRDDLFLEEINGADEEEEDEEQSASRLIKSVAAGIFLLAVLSGVFYLLVMPGGQKLMASLGMGASASGYAALGEDYIEEGSMQRAAQAYYDALRRDPNNYDYALKVAKTQEMIGDQDRALKAYAKCISLKPDQSEPYAAVAAIYRQMGDTEHEINALKLGFDRTGDLELFRAYEALVNPDAPKTGEGVEGTDRQAAADTPVSE